MSEAYKTLVANDPIKIKTLLSPEVLEDAWLHDQMIREVGMQLQLLFHINDFWHRKQDWIFSSDNGILRESRTMWWKQYKFNTIWKKNVKMWFVSAIFGVRWRFSQSEKKSNNFVRTLKIVNVWFGYFLYFLLAEFCFVSVRSRRERFEDQEMIHSKISCVGRVMQQLLYVHGKMCAHSGCCKIYRHEIFIA